MGQVLHGSATTTEAVRRVIQHCQESIEEAGEALRRQPEDHCQVAGANLRFRFGNGPKAPRSTVLSIEEEAVVALIVGAPAASENMIILTLRLQ